MVWNLVFILMAVMAMIACLWPPDLQLPPVLDEPLPVKAAEELEAKLMRADATASEEKTRHLIAKTLAESRRSEIEALYGIIEKLKKRLALYEPIDDDDGLPQAATGLKGP